MCAIITMNHDHHVRVYMCVMCAAGDPPQAWAPFMPYKLQLAANLADYGHVSRALQYCSTLDAALRAAAQAGSTGSRDAQSGIPPSLILMANQLEGLRERLSVHAAAHNIKVMPNNLADVRFCLYFFSTDTCSHAFYDTCAQDSLGHSLPVGCSGLP